MAASVTIGTPPVAGAAPNSGGSVKTDYQYFGDYNANSQDPVVSQVWEAKLKIVDPVAGGMTYDTGWQLAAHIPNTPMQLSVGRWLCKFDTLLNANPTARGGAEIHARYQFNGGAFATAVTTDFTVVNGGTIIIGGGGGPPPPPPMGGPVFEARVAYAATAAPPGWRWEIFTGTHDPLLTRVRCRIERQKLTGMSDTRVTKSLAKGYLLPGNYWAASILIPPVAVRSDDFLIVDFADADGRVWDTEVRLIQRGPIV